MALTNPPYHNIYKRPGLTQLWSNLRVRMLLHGLGLGTLVLIVYFGMWHAYFASLDDFWITGWVRHRANLWMALQGYGSGVRFLNYAPIWLKTQLFGTDAVPYLWSGLVQFLLVVWLVYALARQAARTHAQAPAIALLTALCFAVSYTHYEVVTYISASDYTLWAACYIGIVLLFLRYLQTEARPAYGGAVLLYGLLALGHDFTLNLPLVLLAAHLTVGWHKGSLWQIRPTDLRPHLPFWLIWALHVSLQFYLVFTGTSEAVYSVVDYGPGLHMLSNLRYLIFLLLPNMAIAPIYNFLHSQLTVFALDLLWQVLMGLGVLLQLILLLLAVKGTRLVRFGVALIYLPFLQYTPWHGHFIEAPRYLTLPSIGFALLLGVGLNYLLNRVAEERWPLRLVFAGVVLFVFFNVTIIQIWIQQHVANSELRRTFVTELEHHYLDQIGPDAEVWIEVPAAKYSDLEASCRLVFPYYVPCHTFIGDGATAGPPGVELGNTTHAKSLFWLKVTPVGIVQRLPLE